MTETTAVHIFLVCFCFPLDLFFPLQYFWTHIFSDYLLSCEAFLPSSPSLVFLWVIPLKKATQNTSPFQSNIFSIKSFSPPSHRSPCPRTLTLSPAVPQAAHFGDLSEQLAVLSWGRRAEEMAFYGGRRTHTEKNISPRCLISHSVTHPNPQAHHTATLTWI